MGLAHSNDNYKGYDVSNNNAGITITRTLKSIFHLYFALAIQPNAIQCTRKEKYYYLHLI